MLFGVLLCLLSLLGTILPVVAEEPPPLPLHSVEGYGGCFCTGAAYLVNPAAEGDIFGKPSFGSIFVYLGNGRHLEAYTVTETLWDRLELGYALDRFDMGDLPSEIRQATGIRIGDDEIEMHNFNGRIALIREGDLDYAWAPALTAGVHYKYNSDIKNLDQQLMGTLKNIGIEHKDGLDFTLNASKMVTCLPRPVIVSGGLRYTEAAHLGLLGFTDNYQLVAEGSVVLLATDRLLFCAEYRQKPAEYHEIPNLVEDEDDWWTLCAGYIVNSHMTIAGGYGHFGRILNHDANASWAIAAKWEF